MKGNKYHARKTAVCGLVFDSAKEARRFRELKLLEASGAIEGLRVQVRFRIVPKSGAVKRARFYVADFTYTEGGVQVIEDVKSPATRTNAVYSLKKALVQWQYPDWDFRET